MVRGDTPEYCTPTIEKLQEHIARLIYEWEKDHHESIARTVGHNAVVRSVPANKQGKKADKSNTKTTGAVTTSVPVIDKTITCDGCGYWGHHRDDCGMKDRRDFNATGPWKDSKSGKVVRATLDAKGLTGKPSFLHKFKNADNSHIRDRYTTTSSRSQTPTSPRETSDNRDIGGRRNEGRSKDRGGGVQFNNRRDPGTNNRTTTITHLTCNCGTAQTDTTYRPCLVSLRRSTIYCTAYTSFVNREIARWFQQQEDKKMEGSPTDAG